jgi:hypothetical protein
LRAIGQACRQDAKRASSTATRRRSIIGDESRRLERLVLEADALVASQRQPRERPAQGRRHCHLVTTAMATIMVKRSWLSAPIDKPIDATITSVEPRAFMPQPSARDSRALRPPRCNVAMSQMSHPPAQRVRMWPPWDSCLSQASRPEPSRRVESSLLSCHVMEIGSINRLEAGHRDLKAQETTTGRNHSGSHVRPCVAISKQAKVVG